MNEPYRTLLAAEADAFRIAMRRHALSVCILSAGGEEDANGMAVTSAGSFSMAPPSMLVSVNTSASLSPTLQIGAPLGLTVLGRQHQEVVAVFSRKPSGRTRFDTGDWRLGPDEPPWLAGASANLSCVVEAELAYGSHRALVARVLKTRLGDDGPGIIYRDGEYI